MHWMKAGHTLALLPAELSVAKATGSQAPLGAPESGPVPELLVELPQANNADPRNKTPHRLRMDIRELLCMKWPME